MSAAAYDDFEAPRTVADAVAEIRAARDPNRRPFIPPVLDREAQEQLIAEGRAADRRAETLRTAL